MPQRFEPTREPDASRIRVPADPSTVRPARGATVASSPLTRPTAGAQG